jgi:hypothetical protein
VWLKICGKSVKKRWVTDQHIPEAIGINENLCQIWLLPCCFFSRPEQRWAALSEKPPPRSGNSDIEPLPGERRKKEPNLFLFGYLIVY